MRRATVGPTTLRRPYMTETGSGAPDDLIGVDEASALLEVTPDRVEVMVAGGPPHARRRR